MMLRTFKTITPTFQNINILYAFFAYFSIATITIYLNKLGIATIWIPNAIIVIFILRGEKDNAWYYLAAGGIANCFSHLMNGSTPFSSVCFLIYNLIGLIPVTYYAVQYLKFPATYKNLNKHLLSLFFWLVVGSFLSAVIGSYQYSISIEQPYVQTVVKWFSANLIGLLIILPLALSYSRQNLETLLQKSRIFEYAAIAIISSIITIVSYIYFPFPFIIISQVLLFSSFRYGFFGTSLLNIIVAICFVLLISFRITANNLADGTILFQQGFLLTSLTLLPPLVIAYLIEQRYLFENKLSESEARFRGAMEYSAIGMAILSLEGKWISTNQSLCDILGYQKTELMKIKYNDLIYPDDLASNSKLMHQVIDGNIQTFKLEKRYIHQTGKPVWIQLVVSGVYDKNQTLIYFILQIQNIDQRIHMEKALHESEERWKFALESAEQGVWDLDPRTGNVFISKFWKGLLGYQENEMGNTLNEWIALIHPEDRDHVSVNIRHALEGDTDEYACEYRILCKDAIYRWILDKGKVIEKSSSHQPERMIGTYTDIHQLKMTEEESKKLSQRLLLAIEAGSAGIFEYDIHANFLNWDDRMLQLYGIDKHAFTPDLNSWFSRIHPDDLDREIALFQSVIKDKNEYETEYRIIYPSGEVRSLRAKGIILKNGYGTPYSLLGLNWDITDQKQLTTDLFHEKERLRVTLQSIGDAVIVVNDQGCIDYMNPIAEELLGYKTPEAQGKAIDEICYLMSEDNGKRLINPAITCLKNKMASYSHETSILVNKMDEYYYIQNYGSPIQSQSNEIIGAVLVLHDVTVNRDLQNELKYQASHDLLTGLINRREFEHQLSEIINHNEHSHHGHSLCFIDLDRFKIVNDTAGHAAGDELLRNLGVNLQQCIRESDTIARLGGDEFGLILPHCPIETAVSICEQIIQTLKNYKFTWNGKIYDVGASIGLVNFQPQTSNVATLMSQADVACYAAKNQGGNTVSVYIESDSEASLYHTEIKIVSDIKEALEASRFSLFAHEIKSLSSNVKPHSYYELLIRLIDSNGQLLPPKQFIPAAERYNLMVKIDEWVIKKVLLQLDQKITATPNLSVSINLSANSINSPTFLQFLRNTLAVTSIPKHRIGFELTETAVINHLTKAGEFLRVIQNEGCFVALDDFGTGLSSFNYLKHFPVKYVKIDGSFVRMIDKSHVDLAIVESINQLAHRLDALTIAEFAESPQIIHTLTELGVDYAQGHAISEPMLLENLLDKLGEQVE